MDNHDAAPHIWALINLYHPNFSGAAIQAHKIYKSLIQRGFTVTVLAGGYLAAKGLQRKDIQRDSINIKYLPLIHIEVWKPLRKLGFLYLLASYFLNRVASLSFGISAAWTLLHLGRRGDILRVYAPDEFSFLSVWVAKIRSMHPVLQMNLMGSDDPTYIKQRRDKISALLQMQAFRRAEAVTGHSSAQVQSCIFASVDPGKVFLIHGGVEADIFRTVSKETQAAIRQKLGLETEHRYIIFIGATRVRKGIDVIVRAFVHLRQQIDNVDLLIVGPSVLSDRLSSGDAIPLVTDLKRELEKAGLAPFVHWVGRVDNVHEYLQASDVFCLPSRREGFGLVIIEAMAVGLPVVVSRLEGITTDIIRSESEGILIRGHNHRDYAEALLQILQDPSSASSIGLAARERAKSVFDIEVVANSYVQLFERLSRVT
jgi:glycosyltransferase involved in cell wall biosynthesis